MLFLKGSINNEWVSLEVPFSIEIHFCSKQWFFRSNGFRQCGSFDEMALDEMVLDEVSRIPPNGVQLSATPLTIHIKCEQDWPTRLCVIEFRKSDYSHAIMHFML